MTSSCCRIILKLPRTLHDWFRDHLTLPCLSNPFFRAGSGAGKPVDQRLILEEIDRRLEKDRRKRPTPALSRYIFFGQRKTTRRKSDWQGGDYVDRYSSSLLFFLVAIIGLNVLDAFLTLLILDLKGWEANPVVHSVISLYGTKFWVWKFSIVSVSLVLLCLHSKFRLVKEVIIAISCLYIMVVAYQVILLLYI